MYEIYFQIIPPRMRSSTSKYGKILFLNLDVIHMSIHFICLSILCCLKLFIIKSGRREG